MFVPIAGDVYKPTSSMGVQTGVGGGATPTYPVSSTATNPTNQQPAPTQVQNPNRTLQAAAPKQIPYTNAQIQDMMKNTLLGDQTLKGQINQLQTGLQSQWQGSVITPLQQAYINYGGALPQTIIDQLKGLSSPTIWNPYGPDLSSGMSIGSALDPATQAAAAGNPNSIVNQLARQYDASGGALVGGIQTRGLRNSGASTAALATNEQNYQTDQASKAQDFLNAMLGNYNSYLGNLQTAGNTETQDYGQAQDRLINLINQGYYSLPTTYSLSSPQTPPEYPTSGPTSRFYRSGKGPYGAKPLY